MAKKRMSDSVNAARFSRLAVAVGVVRVCRLLGIPDGEKSDEGDEGVEGGMERLGKERQVSCREPDRKLRATRRRAVASETTVTLSFPPARS